MRELSLHILDIAENSVKAGATLIEIGVAAEGNLLTLTIKDNGKGMDDGFLKEVYDPFTTTRTTRKVGLGIPLFKQAAEAADGTFKIESEVGRGTEVTATFAIDSIDRPPLGDMVSTVAAQLNDDIDYVWSFKIDGREFVFDTREVKAELGGASVTNPEITVFIKELLTENIETVYGGKVL